MIPSNEESLEKVSLTPESQTLLYAHLQDQWNLETTEKGVCINPSAKYTSNFQPFTLNKFIWISKEEDLKVHWDKIAAEKVLGLFKISISIFFFKSFCIFIGFDIEQTFHNSYFGYICLVQISTPNSNYILDIITLRPIIRSYLQLVLENPKIIKIFYSGDNDIFWLQRDFSLRVFSYFDVKVAALFLNKTIDCSLSHLIETFCESGKMDKKQKKTLQVSDWFNRPLSEEQLNYAAMDSHYLISLREKLLSVIFGKTQDLNSIIGFLEKMEGISKKNYQTKEFNKLEAFETFNKKYKEAKGTAVKKKEEKKRKKRKKWSFQQMN